MMIVAQQPIGAKIPARHSVREDFAGCSTGASTCGGRIGYYATKGHAVHAFEDVLAEYDLCFDELSGTTFTGNDGYVLLAICNGDDGCVGHACISWHCMESGSYEFVGYIS